MRTASRWPSSPDSIESIWSGAVVAIIGGGPSLRLEDVEACRYKVRLIAINDAIRLAPWADLLYFCDRRWYEWHRDAVKRFEGMKVTLGNFELRAELSALKCLRNDGDTGLCLERDGLRTGKNSAYQVLNLCVHLGARRAILLGIDMKPAGKRTHWFGSHPSPTTPSVYEAEMLPRWPSIVEPIRAAGLEVLNATPDSALEVFPKVELREALCAP